MTGRASLIAAAALAAIAAGWFLLRPPETVNGAGKPAVVAGKNDVATGSQGGMAASAPAEAPPKAMPPVPRTATPTAKATLFNEYLSATSYRAIYDRLLGSAEGSSPEGKYVLYEILRRCAEVTERDWRRPIQRPTVTKREEFLASLAPGDPNRERRIAAYEQVAFNKCAGFEGVTITHADLNRMLAESAAGGDPKARAHTLELDLWASRRSDRRTTLTDEQFNDLKQIAGTKDPEAIMIAGRLMSNSWHEYAVRMVPDGPNVDPRAFHNAFLVLACDYGAPCDGNNARILQACAFQGHCDAGNLRDYLFYYGISPHDSELVGQYRTLLREAIETGDWGRFNVARGPVPTGAPRIFFGPGPR
jgi:hypothetical protein